MLKTAPCVFFLRSRCSFPHNMLISAVWKKKPFTQWRAGGQLRFLQIFEMRDPNSQRGCNMFRFMTVIVFSNLWMLVSISADCSYQRFPFHQRNTDWGYPNLDKRTFYIPYKYEISISTQMYIHSSLRGKPHTMAVWICLHLSARVWLVP